MVAPLPADDENLEIVWHSAFHESDAEQRCEPGDHTGRPYITNDVIFADVIFVLA